MNVAIIKNDKLDYNRDAPFNPAKNYPEYPFKPISQKNAVYESIRNIFFMLGMDKENFNTESWNPFGEIIKPNYQVLIKPNLVRQYNLNNLGIDQVITHGSIIRVILDYVNIALKGKGSIIIGDDPFQDTDFEKVVKIVGIDKILDFYKDNSEMKIALIDFRKKRTFEGRYHNIKRIEQKGDPFGYTTVDLKENSELFEIIDDYKKFRVTNYDKEEMIQHHNKNKNEYLIPNSVLNSDVIINLPKLKTHQKVGLTCSLKNMIGICTSKDWLPHHRYGSIEEGGDEYLHKSFRKKVLSKIMEQRNATSSQFQSAMMYQLNRLIYRTSYLFSFKDQYFEGNWYGNDTIPRTTIDLNKILFYTDKTGSFKNEISRKMFVVVDAIVAGEKQGPVGPSPKGSGLLVAGYNPVAVDLVCCSMMGFDYKKIPIFKHALNVKKYKIFNGKPEEIKVVSDKCKKFIDIYNEYNCNFVPHDNWRGHIEYGKMG